MGALDGFERAFVDSSYLVALYGTSDRLHPRAVELLAEAGNRDVRLCTIWDCISESLTLLRRYFGYAPARALADSVEDLRLVTYDTSHRLEALGVFRRFSRKRPLSFVDALCSVVVRRELAGAPALSFDRDFRKLGLTVIS
jgi:predicted nucleic acid-binding protein